MFAIMKYQEIKKEIESFGFNVVSHDFERPWGGFLVIDETQAQNFSNKFFEGLDVNTLKIGGKLSPKILMVKPNARLSWQYHKRRAEIWQHTDATYPSNEDDIIRVQDDFGR